MPVPDAGEPFDAGSYTPIECRAGLGLNDATYLLPLWAPDAGSPFPTAEAMIPRVLFDRVSTTPGDVVADLSRLRIVAIRFDICNRSTTAPCRDGRWRHQARAPADVQRWQRGGRRVARVLSGASQRGVRGGRYAAGARQAPERADRERVARQHRLGTGRGVHLDARRVHSSLRQRAPHHSADALRADDGAGRRRLGVFRGIEKRAGGFARIGSRT